MKRVAVEEAKTEGKEMKQEKRKKNCGGKRKLFLDFSLQFLLLLFPSHCSSFHCSFLCNSFFIFSLSLLSLDSGLCFLSFFPLFSG